MVLLELGRSLRASLNKLSTIGGASEEVIAAVLNEISRALIESDVNVSLGEGSVSGISLISLVSLISIISISLSETNEGQDRCQDLSNL